MSDFDARMRALRERFIVRAIADRSALRNAATRGDTEETRRLAHGLAGNAGLFGYAEISELAARLEEALSAPASADRLPELARDLLDQLDQLD